jgi:hypothetical protein
MTLNGCGMVKNLRLLALGLLVATYGAAPVRAQGVPGFGTVMTYNVYEGTNFDQLVGVTDLFDFLLGVGRIVTQVQGTNPPERMQAIAQKIFIAQPELVSLEEVDHAALAAGVVVGNH